MPSTKVFTDNENFVSKHPRNSYDQSHRVYGTYQIGGIYPLGAPIEVNAGDSVRIDIEALYNMFPMTWPLQTPLRVHYYVVYNRWRNLWKSWKDFSYNNKQPVHPFILQPSSNKKFWKTGSLADHLGIPTTYSDSFEDVVYGGLPIQSFPLLSPMMYTYLVPGRGVSEAPDFLSSKSLYDYLSGGVTFQSDPMPDFSSLRGVSDSGIDDQPRVLTFSPIDRSRFVHLTRLVFGSSLSSTSPCYLVVSEAGSLRNPKILGDLLYTNTSSGFNINSSTFYIRDSHGFIKTVSFSDMLATSNAESFCISLVMSSSFIGNSGIDLDSAVLDGVFVGGRYNWDLDNLGGVVDMTTDGYKNPFAGTVANPPDIPINALPFRAYEATYNALFRDEKNDPFIKNGEIEYNEYITTDADGADTTPYELKFRNWEKDFLVSASQSPQQGVAPLVGINYRGDLEFMNNDGTIAKIRPVIDSDGETITGVSGFLENASPEALRSAMDLVSMGISINDFRQVGAFQRWLENNIRRGLKYRDQVMANTGVQIKYNELDMPEFIGGFSRPVQVSQVTQMTPSSGEDAFNALGTRAGQGTVYAKGKHQITHYCDEAGCIMILMCVTPQPVYTQLLPKIYLKSDALSYYHPQFGKIGPQPISYREVCPVQCANLDYDYDNTFGYQRPWYDLISATDSAHGQFRLSTMRDMLMQRTFAGVPELGGDFLHIDPYQLNNVFAYKNPNPDAQEDVICGQTYLEIFVKRAIPRFGIPRIEA